jgi:hypothetical protein
LAKLITLNPEEPRILSDDSKAIYGDIIWQNHPQHELLMTFKAEISSAENAYPLSLRGTYNLILSALSYHIICPPYGRIYGLDVGKAHKNPSGERVGETHKHRWSEIYRDKEAYEPPDITASGQEPIQVWQ